MQNKISIRNAKNAKSGLQDMIDYIDLPRESIILEIGSYVGDSTEIFAKNYDKVIAVDPWVNGYDDRDAASYQHDMKTVESQFDDLMKKYDNIVKHKMTSSEYRDICFHRFDMIYIDGLHTYKGVKSDFTLWHDMIKHTGGWICGHDYQDRFPGTIKAIDEFRKPDKIFGDTSWCIKIVA